jgi:hypothetical protein
MARSASSTALSGLVALVALASLVPSGAAAGQIRASERARVMQTVDGTEITVDYARPRARGRDSLFGNVVHWGETWTPGANDATTLEVSRPVTIAGRPVPRGRYSVWMIVREREPWTVVLDTAAGLYHTQRPRARGGQIRFEVRPERRPPVEVLTWSFPEVRADGTVLAMQWGPTYVPLDVAVEPRYARTVPATIAARYVGTYGVASGSGARGGSFVVSHDGRSLRGRWSDAPFPEIERVLLLPVAEHLFLMAVERDGRIHDVFSELMVEFDAGAGRAAGFEVRTRRDDLWASGRRR